MDDGEGYVDGGKRWRLTLREGLRFHDGEPVLARDLLFALGRVLSLRLRNTTVRIRR